jgi:hypothetical protein
LPSQQPQSPRRGLSLRLPSQQVVHERARAVRAAAAQHAARAQQRGQRGALGAQARRRPGAQRGGAARRQRSVGSLRGVAERSGVSVSGMRNAECLSMLRMTRVDDVSRTSGAPPASACAGARQRAAQRQQEMREIPFRVLSNERTAASGASGSSRDDNARSTASPAARAEASPVREEAARQHCCAGVAVLSTSRGAAQQGAAAAVRLCARREARTHALRSMARGTQQRGQRRGGAR